MMVISDIFLVQSVRVLSHLQCTTLQLQRNLFGKSKVCQDNHNEGIFPFDFTDLFLTPLNMHTYIYTEPCLPCSENPLMLYLLCIIILKESCSWKHILRILSQLPLKTCVLHLYNNIHYPAAVQKVSKLTFWTVAWWFFGSHLKLFPL